MLNSAWFFSWSWAWFWWGTSRLLYPIWKFPLLLGFKLSADQLLAWGRVLGYFFTIRQGLPVIELFWRVGRDENARRY